MKWFTHQAIAVGTAFCLGMEIPALVGAVVGAVLPDVLDQRMAGLAHDRQKSFTQIHRSTTHWFGWWLGLWFFALTSFVPLMVQPVLAGLGFGALLHVALDMCTVSGIPITPWSRKNKISLKLCRTGGLGEYLFLTFSALLFCLLQYERLLPALEKAGRASGL